MAEFEPTDVVPPEGAEPAPPGAVARAPRQERGRKRLDEILDAAEQVMLEVGPTGASIQEIARRAGASVGSIYHFFPTKEAILAALQARYIAESDEVVRAIRDEVAAGAALPLAQFVDKLLSPFAAFVARRPAAFVLGPEKSGHEKDPLMHDTMRAALRTRDPVCSDEELARRLDVLFIIGSGIADSIVRSGGADAAKRVVEMKRAMYGYLLACEEPAHRLE